MSDLIPSEVVRKRRRAETRSGSAGLRLGSRRRQYLPAIRAGALFGREPTRSVLRQWLPRTTSDDHCAVMDKILVPLSKPRLKLHLA